MRLLFFLFLGSPGMTILSDLLAQRAANAAKYAPNATRRETVNGVEHLVFDYRERAESVQTGRGINRSDRDGLARYVEEYPKVPDYIMAEAAPHASRMATVMQRSVPALQRHQAHGSLDTSKLARLAAPNLSAREFDSMAQRAYRRRENATRADKPRIAVAGDFAYKLRVENDAYVPMLARLVLIITEACTISGMQCAAYGTRGHIIDAGHPHGNSHRSATAVIKNYDDELNGATYGLIATEAPFSVAYCSCTNGAGSMTGNGGVDFARAQGANFVIAIGNFPDDGARADCVVPPNATVQEAVNIISDALQRLF